MATRKSVGLWQAIGPYGRGFLTGLLVGVVLSALMIIVVGSKPIPKEPDKQATTRMNTEKMAGNNTDGAAIPEKPIQLPNTRPTVKGSAAQEVKEFDFYNQQDKPPQKPRATGSANVDNADNANINPSMNPAEQSSLAPEKSAMASVKDSKKPVVEEKKKARFLVSKSYSKLSEAETVKADLALQGFETKMVVVDGRFQLQLGPYATPELAAKAKKELEAQGNLFSLQ